MWIDASPFKSSCLTIGIQKAPSFPEHASLPGKHDEVRASDAPESCLTLV
jgi:hypothetical protein